MKGSLIDSSDNQKDGPCTIAAIAVMAMLQQIKIRMRKIASLCNIAVTSTHPPDTDGLGLIVTPYVSTTDCNAMHKWMANSSDVGFVLQDSGLDESGDVCCHASKRYVVRQWSRLRRYGLYACKLNSCIESIRWKNTIVHCIINQWTSRQYINPCIRMHQTKYPS